MDDEFTGIEEAAEAEDAIDLAVLDGIDEDEPDEDEPDEGELETEVTCTEHTPENLRGYAILLAVALFILVSSAIRAATGQPGIERTVSALAILLALVVIALAGYMLFVWKNRKVVVGPDGIALTDFMGRESTCTWDQVRIVDRRTSSTPEIAFRMGKREETFAGSCGGFRRMCELLIRMGKMRRIDERALAKKRKAKSLFDVVQGGSREEKVDESLYLPEDPKDADRTDRDS